MKITRNNDGTFNLAGVPERQLFAIHMFAGNANSQITYSILKETVEIFPINSLYNYGLLATNIPGVALEFEKAYSAYKSAKSVARPDVLASDLTGAFSRVGDTKQNHLTQKRGKNGRFIAKKWVARFNYPDSQNWWVLVRRAVIIDSKDGNASRINPQSSDLLPIVGRDMARNHEWRNFSSNKIIGAVKWSQEYVD